MPTAPPVPLLCRQGVADLPISAGVDATRSGAGYPFASCRDGTPAFASEITPFLEIVQTVNTPPGDRTAVRVRFACDRRGCELPRTSGP